MDQGRSEFHGNLFRIGMGHSARDLLHFFFCEVGQNLRFFFFHFFKTSLFFQVLYSFLCFFWRSGPKPKGFKCLIEPRKQRDMDFFFFFFSKG